MKKYNILTLAVCSVMILQSNLLCSCTNDELVSDDGGTVSDAVTFNTSLQNLTRADGQKLQDSHNQFGVYTYYSTLEKIMDNYLVGWGGEGSPFKNYNGEAQTYGDPDSQVTGLSYWYYQGLGNTSGKHPTDYKPDAEKQLLKFWDKSKPETYFFAYTPYTNAPAPAAENPINWKDGEVWHTKFIGLNAFYTDPVKQINGITETGKALLDKYDVLHAVKKVAKANYGEDVDLQFKHVNAKVNIAFYNDMNGYDVKLIDMVPTEGLTGPNSSTIDYAPGIQLSPATAEQAATPMTTTQPAEDALPTYTTQSTITVTYPNVAIDDATTYASTVVKKDVKDNLEFKLIEGNLPTSGASSAAVSPTSLIVLPNANSEGGYIENTPASTTGFTIHVSYQLKPKGGGRTLTIYDARAYVPASCCKWEPGKAYTYIFKITAGSSGIQVSTTEDPATAGTTHEPWIDKRDPRVPGGQMRPIVFDALKVSGYDETSGGEYIIQQTGPKTPTGLAAVDIGTGSQFANMNLEANDYYYFSWGNIDGHPIDYPFGDYYDHSAAKSITADNIQGQIYNPGSIYETSGDAATYRWGTGWCMPTVAQFEALFTITDPTDANFIKKEWKTINGIEGIEFSKGTEKFFLPATGYSLNGANTTPADGYYWTADKKVFHISKGAEVKKTVTNPETHEEEQVFDYYAGAYSIIEDFSLSYGLCIRPIVKVTTP